MLTAIAIINAVSFLAPLIVRLVGAEQTRVGSVICNAGNDLRGAASALRGNP